MSDIEDPEVEVETEENAFVNEITLNFLISKNQLQKLNKMKQKETLPEHNYDKDRVTELFNKLLNNNRPDDLLEDVKTCFDAFIEKSIYYLEIHDKNINIQNDRNDQIEKEDCDDEDCDEEDDEDCDEEDDEEDDEDCDEEEEEDLINNDEYFEEPVVKVTAKYSNNKVTKSKGVEDIHKLPLDWFNTTRQNYKINQIIPRKKEIIIDNSSLKKKKI
jgi:hypothetical protein